MELEIYKETVENDGPLILKKGEDSIGLMGEVIGFTRPLRDSDGTIFGIIGVHYKPHVLTKMLNPLVSKFESITYFLYEINTQSSSEYLVSNSDETETDIRVP